MRPESRSCNLSPFKLKQKASPVGGEALVETRSAALLRRRRHDSRQRDAPAANPQQQAAEDVAGQERDIPQSLPLGIGPVVESGIASAPLPLLPIGDAFRERKHLPNA